MKNSLNYKGTSPQSTAISSILTFCEIRRIPSGEMRGENKNNDESILFFIKDPKQRVCNLKSNGKTNNLNL